MPYRNISAQLSAADIQAIKDALATIEAKLPFLISLPPAERLTILKTGPGSLAFVQNSLQAAKNNPGVLPPVFRVDEFEKDVNLFSALTELGTVVMQLAAKIDDTRMEVGGEAMRQAVDVYNYVKAAAASTPGLKPVADQLAERFQKSKQPPAPATTPPGQ